MKRCSKGHFFDEKRHSGCPYCGVGDMDVMATRMAAPSAASPEDRVWKRDHAQHDAHTPDGRVAALPHPAPPASDGTIGLFDRGMSGRRAVVGWLVCVRGPDRGRDFRLGEGRNSIGRSDAMDVRIKGDQGVSRERHAIVSFDPKSNVFKIHPGESHGLTYVNGSVVDGAMVLQHFDRIEVGATELVFVSLCGDRFRWDAP